MIMRRLSKDPKIINIPDTTLTFYCAAICDVTEASNIAILTLDIRHRHQPSRLSFPKSSILSLLLRP